MHIETAILTSAELQPAPYTGDSLAEVMQYHPEGVYTITRTFNRVYALLLDAHLDRLEESARLEDIPLRLNRAALRAALRELINRSNNTESRFGVTAPRQDPDRLHLALEPLRPVPPELRQNGVTVMTIDAQRQNPVAKASRWMKQRREAAVTLPPEVYETILTDAAGQLLEGSGSNFYAVLGGELRTAGEGVLSGIARRAVLECVGDTLPVRLEGVRLDDLPRLQEAFLTSSSRGVVPIVAINGQAVGDGKPGTITRQLARRYDAWTAEHLEPI